MKRLSLFRTASLLAAVFTSLTWLSNSQAIPCVNPPELGVSDSVACVNGPGDGSNDFPAPETVNDLALHGYDDWVYLQKKEFDPDQLLTNVDVDFMAATDNGGADDSGTWSFAQAVWELYQDVMIVLKTGKNGDPPEDIRYAAYLLDNTVQPTSGTWYTGDGINGSGKQISHITLYARGTPGDTDMPEPSTALLVLLVLGGLTLRNRMTIAQAKR